MVIGNCRRRSWWLVSLAEGDRIRRGKWRLIKEDGPRVRDGKSLVAGVVFPEFVVLPNREFLSYRFPWQQKAWQFGSRELIVI